MSKLDVRVYPLFQEDSSTRAFASVTIEDLVAIRGIRVIEGEKGLFVAMPQSFNKKDETYHDIAFPVTENSRKALNKAVLDEYRELVKAIDMEAEPAQKSDKPIQAAPPKMFADDGPDLD